MEPSEAYEVLRGADDFAASRVGAAGLIPETVRAFLTLLQDPQADRLFKSLLSEATLPGQLYALCGVYVTDRAAFEGVAERYRHLEDSVMTVAACIAGSQRACDIVESKSLQALRLDYPTQAFAEWYQRHREEYRYGWEVDIVGGGYPAEFLSVCDLGS